VTGKLLTQYSGDFKMPLRGGILWFCWNRGLRTSEHSEVGTVS